MVIKGDTRNLDYSSCHLPCTSSLMENNWIFISREGKVIFHSEAALCPPRMCDIKKCLTLGFGIILKVCGHYNTSSSLVLWRQKVWELNVEDEKEVALWHVRGQGFRG